MKKVLVYISLMIALPIAAQTDPVLMRINGKEILRSEFEYSYKKSPAYTEGQKTPREYADEFVGFKLKVSAAEAAGLDTTLSFRKEADTFHRQLVQSSLTDEEAAEQAARQYYDRKKTESRGGQIYVKQIFKYLPQNATGYTLRSTEARMDSLYRALKDSSTPAAFDDCVEKFSDAKEAFWVKRLQMPVEFEDVVFAMQAGELSRPFFTPQGIHIVKVLECREFPSFEEVKPDIMARQIRSYDTDKGAKAAVERLKKEFQYTPDEAAIKELLSKGITTKRLFVLGGQPYTGKDFARFAAAHQESVRRQWDAFVMKCVLDCANASLKQTHPEFRWLVQMHRDSLLVAEITRRKFGERTLMSEAEMQDYFDKHRADYNWKQPHYKGIVLHCKTKRVAKQVRKFLKQLPEEERLDAIRLSVNSGDEPEVQAEQGLFAPGDNEYVDEKVFKKKKATPDPSFPFTEVLGKKQKGPESYKEVQHLIVSDYFNTSEAGWVSGLRAAAKVEIDQEVLKTVNNH